MASQTTKRCTSANPATCRYHRAGFFANSAVKMYFDTIASATWNVEGRTKLSKELRPQLEAYASLLATEMDEKLKSGELDPEDRSYSRQVSTLGEKVIEKVQTENPVSSKKFSELHSYVYTLADCLKDQFNRANPTVQSKPNALTDENVSPFDRSAANMLVAEGSWVDKGSEYYGSWKDERRTLHYRKCGPAYVSVPHEDSWETFSGTFASFDDTDHGMTADTACNCGALKGSVRVEGSFTDLTRNLVNNYTFER